MSLLLAIVNLVPLWCSCDIESAREQNPNKVKEIQYTQQELMHVIKESYNKTKQVLWERNISLYYIKVKVEITTKALMSQGPLSMTLFFHTHTFSNLE
jgi:hypothetical protein